MSTHLRFLLAAAFLTLAPTTASALPPQCDEICFDTDDCDTLCAFGSRVTTCRGARMCFLPLDKPSDPTASVTQEDARLSDEASLVCSEEQPAAEG